MSTLMHNIYAIVYFFSFATILVAFFWDFIRIPKWAFMLCSILCYLLVTHTGWLFTLFSWLVLPHGFFYALLCLILAFVMLFLLVKAHLFLILYAIFTVSAYAFFMKGMEVWIYHPTDGWALSIRSQILSCIMYIIMTSIITIMIRTSIVPLFKSCEDKKIWLWLSTPSFLGTIGFWFLFMDAENFVQIPDTMYIGSLLLFITLLASNIVGVKNIKISIKSAQYETEAKNAEELLTLQKEHYQHLSSSMEETRMAKHDMRHHMHTISGFLEKCDYDALKEYLKQYDSTIPETVVYTGHSGIDAILGHTLALAKQANIPVSYNNLVLPSFFDIKDTDLTVIFGNCMENAIEASQSVEVGNRFIKIYSLVQGNCLALVFENSYSQPIEEKGFKLLSTKRNYTKPGIGLLSLNHIVEQYNGRLDIHYEDQIFSVMIYLQLNDMSPHT